ncbi:hypothetical protein HN371_08150 [Candidatus Poribacteria bacterium]|jgi:hypothetical protein|nr:hypothetical protein [Candidatus Poribacteria bacterium]MBT5537044.1 hypothetical protein [Candidatus Poribacteria bacterium]MBT5713312.1 hypothetical protein [Candidatus Poribacteria bacterium]MBT7100950.1 hypothetical protein [Candidatus Poribacteria bacterium]MBT7809009.1 hypothetical protein [Candidatus Poribacteria bacterium]
MSPVELSPIGSRPLVAGMRGSGCVSYLVDAGAGTLGQLIPTGVGAYGAHRSAAGAIYYVPNSTALGGLRRVDIRDRSITQLQAGWRIRRLRAMSPDGQCLLPEGEPFGARRRTYRRTTFRAPWSRRPRRRPGGLAAAGWFIPRSLLAMSPAGKRAVTWGALRSGVD